MALGCVCVSLTDPDGAKREAQVVCEVNLRTLPGFSLQLRSNISSGCTIKTKTKTRTGTGTRTGTWDLISLSPGTLTQLQFDQCQPQDVQVTAAKTLGCSSVGSCSRLYLAVPSLPSCLLPSLLLVSWSLSLPPAGTVELGCSSGTLRRELPGQLCNDSLTISLHEHDKGHGEGHGDGEGHGEGHSNIGTFCRGGSITKLQIHNNISIAIRGRGALQPGDVLTARVKDEITESYIVRVSPQRQRPLVLATPGWPAGMRADSTLSWIVSVPPKMEAWLQFSDLRQPKCSHRHTAIRIRRLDRQEEEFSRREDEEVLEEVRVSSSFFLNMSNCLPENGVFRVLTRVTLRRDQTLIIVVSSVAALLLVFILILIVVCLVTRQKKTVPQTSIYSSFLQNPVRSEEEHVYEDIEDTLVYSHLLRKGETLGTHGEFQENQGNQENQEFQENQENQAEVCSYQDFVQEQKPELPQRPQSHTLHMEENLLYEIKKGERMEEEEEEGEEKEEGEEEG
ncbi:unnamed protein product [Knipowitschia caucasica]